MRQFFVITLFSCLAFTLAVAPRTHAQTADWTLMTASFDRQLISITGIQGGNLIFTRQGKTDHIPLDQVLRLDRQEQPSSESGSSQLFLANGDRLAGQCGDLDNDTLKWTSPTLGAMKFPIDQVQAIVPTGGDASSLAANRKEDQIILANHDQISGVISAISGGKISIQANGQTTAIPLTSISAVLFASNPSSQHSIGEAYRLILRGPSKITVHDISVKDGRLTADFPGIEHPQPIEFNYISSIEHLNGPVSWLSDRTPITSEQSAFMSALSYSAQMDRNVFGGPLRFESETYSKGIGVHANSKLVFALDGSYPKFRTRFAIDTGGECSKADVNVRILLDGKAVYEKQHIRAYQAPPLVELNLGHAKTLTLEVTAGGATDTQDRLNWLEAALVRQPTGEPRSDGLSPTTGTTGPSN
jgi:NPCBM/NEW2 domain